jgi:hypothetical protein
VQIRCALNVCRDIVGQTNLRIANLLESAYSLAELYALEGRRDEAFAMLGESIDMG